jgi:enoyl-CoA hydratase/carnithine racemase
MLRSTTSNNIAIITIDRPHRRNALGSEIMNQFSKLLWELDHDDNIRAIVIAGAPPGFCAGSDLKELGGMTISEMCRHETHCASVARSITQLSKPVVAAVDGFALGGGFVLAISCDIVVTSQKCIWGLPEVSIGWIPPWGLEFLVARTGPVVAKRLTWGGDPIDGSEAYKLGVADYLVESDNLTAEAIKQAEKLAALPAPAVSATKRYFATHIGVSAEVRDREATLLFAENCQHDVAKTTLNKFGMKL